MPESESYTLWKRKTPTGDTDMMLDLRGQGIAHPRAAATFGVWYMFHSEANSPGCFPYPREENFTREFNLIWEGASSVEIPKNRWHRTTGTGTHMPSPKDDPILIKMKAARDHGGAHDHEALVDTTLRLLEAYFA